MAGSLGTFVASHGLATLIAIGTFISIVFAIRASVSANRASIAAERLARVQADTLICHECIAEGNAPKTCPHTEPPYPKLCAKNKPKK